MFFSIFSSAFFRKNGENGAKNPGDMARKNIGYIKNA